MRHFNTVGIFTVMLILVPSLALAEHVIDDSKNQSYLFVISGTSGSLDGDILTLKGVPNVIYFSDRPERQTGHVSLSKFVEMWSKGNGSLKADPPNAVLSILNGNETIVVELQNAAVQENDISFKIKVLQGTSPKEFKQSSLFIDENGGDGGFLWGGGGEGGSP